MTDSTKLLGISNAIVDVLAHVDEDFLARIGAPRGSMTLIDEPRAREISRTNRNVLLESTVHPPSGTSRSAVKKQFGEQVTLFVDR